MKTKNLILLSLFCLNNLNAEEKKLDDLMLEELMDIKVYSATKSYVRAEEVPSNLTIITKEEIDKFGYKTVIDILKNVPGIYVLDDSDFVLIGIRGSIGSTFKYMINGISTTDVRLPRFEESNRNFYSIPVEAIERIEIVKGPQAVTYGPNAMYGSINVITKNFEKTPTIVMAKGNNGQKKLFASYATKNENGGLSFNSGLYTTKGINGNLEDGLSSSKYNNIDAKANKSFNNLLDNEYKYLDLNYRYKEFDFGFIYSNVEYDSYYYSSVYRDGPVNTKTEKQFSISYENEIIDDLTNKTTLSFTKNTNKIPDYYPVYEETNSNISGDRFYNREIYARELDTHFNYTLNDYNSMLLGYRYLNNDKINSSHQSNGYNYYVNGYYWWTQNINVDYSDITYNDLYLKYRFNYEDIFNINLGYRISKMSDYALRYTLKYRFIDPNGPMYNRFINNKSSWYYPYEDETFKLPEFSVVYNINSNNHIKFLYGEANQLQYNSFNKFENIKSYDLNYQYNTKDILFSNSLFLTKTRNIGLFAQNNLLYSGFDSFDGEYKTYGIEPSLTYKFNKSFQNSLNFVYQKVENGSEETSGLTPPLVPNFYAKYNISYAIGDFTNSFILNYIGKMQASVYDFDTEERYGVDSKPNITLDTNFKYDLDKNSNLNLNITNVLNKDNRIPASGIVSDFEKGFFTPGREFLLKYTYNF